MIEEKLSGKDFFKEKERSTLSLRPTEGNFYCNLKQNLTGMKINHHVIPYIGGNKNCTIR